MKAHPSLAMAVAGLLLVAGTASAEKPPATWDGLVQVKAKRLDLAYLQPGADFRIYTKVMLDPTEVAFQRDWQREHNRSSSPGRRISNSEIEEAVTKGAAAATDIFSEEWTKGGYTVVTEPGPDVLRIKTGIVNIWVNAPDIPTAGRTVSIAPEAGRATFFISDKSDPAAIGVFGQTAAEA